MIKVKIDIFVIYNFYKFTILRFFAYSFFISPFITEIGCFSPYRGIKNM